MTDLIDWGPFWLILAVVILAFIAYFWIQALEREDADQAAADDARWEAFQRDAHDHQRRVSERAWDWPLREDHPDRTSGQEQGR